MYRINLVTTSDITEFTNICQKIDGRVELFCKKTGYRVNGKSLLGCLAAMEFEEVYVDSDKDIYNKIEKWVMNGDDGNYIHE
ncbi:MAG: hypothetical protein ACI311_04810 [Bacilli bacterium]